MTDFIVTMNTILTSCSKHIMLLFTLGLIASVFPCRLSPKKQRLHFFLSILIPGCIFQYLDSVYYGQYSFFIFNVLIILITLLLSTNVYEQNIFPKALLLTLFLSYMSLLRFLFNTAIRSFSAFIPTSFSDALCSLIIDICTYCTAFLIWILFIHFARLTVFRLKPLEVLILTVFACANLFATTCLSSAINGNTGTLLTSFIYADLLFINLFLFHLLSRFSKSNEENMELQKMLQHQKMQQIYFEQVKEASAQMHELRHELHNYMFYIEQLLKEKRYDELENYVANFNCTQLSITDFIDTGNTVISALLNQKRAYARSLGITTDIQVILPKDFAIEEMDLCSLISNLFTNAIEHCSQLKDSEISIEIMPVKNYLSIVFKNRASYDVLKQNPALSTTKKDLANHGIGLKVVRNITAKYDGMLNYKTEEAKPYMFVVQCMLKFQ